MDFSSKWHDMRTQKNSQVVAGLDPAVFEMGRGDKGLPQGASKRDWCLSYIDAVAPYVVAIKPNAGYFGNAGEREILSECIAHARELGLLVIIDAKVSDIGSTSDAWFFDYAQLGADAVTFAPYAGNTQEMHQYIRMHEMASIQVSLMSVPEYRHEMFFEYEGVPLWKYRVQAGLDVGVDAFVAGGTFTKDDVAFTEFVKMTEKSKALYLVPGIGEQGGTVADFFATNISKERCMINSSRGLMFPVGSASLPQQQAEYAKILRDEINDSYE